MEAKTLVNRMKHNPCRKFFYEINNQEIEKCPWCKKYLKTEEVTQMSQQELKVNAISGQAYYAPIHIDIKGANKDGDNSSSN